MKKLLAFLCVSTFILVSTAFGSTSEGGNMSKSEDFIEQDLNVNSVEVVKTASVEQINVEFELTASNFAVINYDNVGTKANEVEFKTPIVAIKGYKVQRNVKTYTEPPIFNRCLTRGHTRT